MDYKQLSYRVYAIVIGLLSLAYSDVMASKSFAGGYGGLGIGYGYTHGKFNGITYRGMSLSTEAHLGYGWISDKLYYGLEGGLAYDAFAKKKGRTDLKQPWQESFSLRIGRILRSCFLPFMRVGVSCDQWALRSSGHTKRFSTTMLLWGVGVDAFVNDRLSIRSEVGYAYSMGLNAAKTISSKKPIKAGVTMGVSYHL